MGMEEIIRGAVAVFCSLWLKFHPMSCLHLLWHLYRVLKLLSEDPSNYRDAPQEGIRRLLEEITGHHHPRNHPVDTSRILTIRMGTTVSTPPTILSSFRSMKQMLAGQLTTLPYRLPRMHCLSGRGSVALWSPPRASEIFFTLETRAAQKSLILRSGCQICSMTKSWRWMSRYRWHAPMQSD